MKCESCGFENLPEMRFCGSCGTRLGWQCTACGFVNPEVHRFCGKCGTSLGEALDQEQRVVRLAQDIGERGPDEVFGPTSLAPAELEGERRLATVILADVVGSTDILERIGTEAWVEAMNRVLQILEGEIFRFGGAVDQFRGDGLVAFFGATIAHEDDPERAVLAALAMQPALEARAGELAQWRLGDVKVRVGINTGDVIVASIGDDRRHREDTAMGEAVTLAARMESAAEPGTVLVSDNTYRIVESQFEWEPLGSIRVKGIGRPVSVYRPLAHRTRAGRVHCLRDFAPSAVLTGREAEFNILKGAVEGLRTGEGGIALVMGDTGMGKSSLVAQLCQHALRDNALLAEAGDGDGVCDLGSVQRRPLAWLQGRCRSYEQTWPYSVWFDLLRDWLDVPEGEPAVETRERLRRRAEVLWGDQAAEHYPLLDLFVSLSLEEAGVDSAKRLDAEGRRQQLFEAVRNWVGAMARQGPLVLALEDVHWADATSLALLEYCLPMCDRAPLLWLIVVRWDQAAAACELCERIETDFADRVVRVTFAPLTETQGGKLIDELIGPDVLTKEARSLLIDRVEGNPYYIEEFIRALVREGVLERDAANGQWHATREVESLDIPDSLQSLLLAGMDRLALEERRVLQMAAVIGPVFWSNVLQVLVAEDEKQDVAALNAHLAALQRAQLIHEHGRAADLGIVYEFESNLVRDAAYEALLSVRRVNCHRKAADALEQIFGESVVTRYYGLLAYHYHQAGAKRKELFYSLLAAGEAREIYANVEAVEHYTRAMELLDEIEAQSDSESQLYAIYTQRFDVLNGRRKVHYLTGDFASGCADAEALLPLAHRLDDDPVWLIDALLEQPGVGFYRSKEDVDVGVVMAEQALTLAQQKGDRYREMRSLAAIAGQRFYLNDPEWQRIAERALTIAREVGDRRFEAGILTGIGGVFASSEPERSVEYLEAAIPIINELDDKMAELELLDVLAVQLESSSDYVRRLLECHEKQLEISREIGHRPAEGRALMFCGQIKSLYLGDYEAGLEQLEMCRDLWDGIPEELFPLLRIAQVQVVQGEYAQARASLEWARRTGGPEVLDIANVGLGLVSALYCSALGDEAHLRRALELTSKAYTMSAENPQLSQQYQMVAACEATAAHLALAKILPDESERQSHIGLALDSSQLAVDVYYEYGFVRPIECTSQEILFRRGLALKARGRDSEAAEFFGLAFEEMMRKHDLIPCESHFRRTFLENIPLHRGIRAAILP